VRRGDEGVAGVTGDVGREATRRGEVDDCWRLSREGGVGAAILGIWKWRAWAAETLMAREVVRGMVLEDDEADGVCARPVDMVEREGALRWDSWVETVELVEVGMRMRLVEVDKY
jgi:hypothetical protein